jgi:sulfur carrier protein ThiS adenylyltransferase
MVIHSGFEASPPREVFLLATASTESITIKVNERPVAVERGATLHRVREALKPTADVVIHNGFTVGEADAPLAEGDEVVLIRRGEIPPAEELEALMVARHGPGVHARVKGARVGIAGCGGLGSAVAVALARTGVGRLLLVDFDIVEPSNLNRQQFFVDQLGLEKTAALTANLARINPYVEVEARSLRLTRENIPEVFAGCDVLCECFDNPAMKRDMTLAVRTRMRGTPLVTVSGIAGYGPAETIGPRKIFENIWLVGDGETAARPGCGLLAPRVAVAAGMQANLVLRIILGEER